MGFSVRVYTFVNIKEYISVCVCVFMFVDACLVCVYLSTHECMCINMFVSVCMLVLH